MGRCWMRFEDSEGGAETNVREKTGNDVVPHREDTELLETAELHRKILQADVAEVQGVETPQFSNIQYISLLQGVQLERPGRYGPERAPEGDDREPGRVGDPSVCCDSAGVQ